MGVGPKMGDGEAMGTAYGGGGGEYNATGGVYGGGGE
jgi:hypothetical protein